MFSTYYTSPGDTRDYVRDNNWTILEKYIQLPGNVLLTIRPQQTNNSQKTYSLPNIHGDIFATTDAQGTLQTTTLTGPFGELIQGQASPNNSTQGSTFSYVGQYEKITESQFATYPTQMGTRVYLASLGRFLQVDPVEGGTANNYVYVTDPVNQFDLTGEFGWGDALTWTTNIATVASFIPGPVGMIASGVAVAGNVAQGKWSDAALAATGLAGMGALTKIAAKAIDAGKAGTFLGGVSKAAGWLAKVQSKMPGIGRASKLFGNDTMGAVTEGLFNTRRSLLKIGWSKWRGRQVFRIGTASQKFHLDLLVGGRTPW